MYTELRYPVAIFDNKTVLDYNEVDSTLSDGLGFSVSNHHNQILSIILELHVPNFGTIGFLKVNIVYTPCLTYIS